MDTPSYGQGQRADEMNTSRGGILTIRTYRVIRWKQNDSRDGPIVDHEMSLV
jgi:hypothetical protein